MIIEKTAKDNGLFGTIGFTKLKISCIIGVENFERLANQDIFVDLQVKYDISPCVESDTFEKAIDYVRLSQICTQLVQEGQYQLIETYAYEVLQHLHKNYPITNSKIRVEKPSAIPEATCSFVELERAS